MTKERRYTAEQLSDAEKVAKTSISIPSKSMQLSYLTLTSANVNLWSIIRIPEVI